MQLLAVSIALLLAACGGSPCAKTVASAQAPLDVIRTTGDWIPLPTIRPKHNRTIAKRICDLSLDRNNVSQGTALAAVLDACTSESWWSLPPLALEQALPYYRAAIACEQIELLTNTKNGLAAEGNQAWRSLIEICPGGEPSAAPNSDTLDNALNSYTEALEKSTLVVEGARESLDAAGPGTAILGGGTSILLPTIISYVEKRAKAEFRQFIVRTIRRRVCQEEKIRRYTAHICTYVGDKNAIFGGSLGPGIRQAAVDDLKRLPAVLGFSQTKGAAPKLLLRAGTHALETYLQQGHPGHFGLSVQDVAAFVCLAEESEATEPHQEGTLCEQVKTTILVTGGLLELIEPLLASASYSPEKIIAAVKQHKGTFLEDLEAEYKRLEVDRGCTLQSTEQTCIAVLNAKEAIKRARKKLDDLLAEKAELKKRIAVFLDAHASFKKAMEATRDAADAEAKLNASLLLLQSTADALIAGTRIASPKHSLLVEQTLAPYLHIAEALAKQEYGRVLLYVQELARSSSATFSPSVARLLSFGVELAQAKSAEEAEAAIEAIAAPVGSWELKTRDPTVSLTGFVGFGGSVDRIEGKSQYGFSPIGSIGLDLSIPTGWGSWGVFGSIVDLGNVLTQRTGSDSEEERTIEQVLSPGAFLRLGHFGGDYPFVIGAGVSYLQDAELVDEGETTTLEDVYRFQVFGAIDLTLFPF